MLQIILHLIGDYITQSDWMANKKTSQFMPAAFLHRWSGGFLGMNVNRQVIMNLDRHGWLYG